MKLDSRIQGLFEHFANEHCYTVCDSFPNQDRGYIKRRATTSYLPPYYLLDALNLHISMTVSPETSQTKRLSQFDICRFLPEVCYHLSFSWFTTILHHIQIFSRHHGITNLHDNSI
jgi:hypothetical protein